MRSSPNRSAVFWDWGNLSSQEQTGARGWQNSVLYLRSGSSLLDKAEGRSCAGPREGLCSRHWSPLPKGTSQHYGSSSRGLGLLQQSLRPVLNWVCSITRPIKYSFTSSWHYFTLLMVRQPCGWALSCCLLEVFQHEETR